MAAGGKPEERTEGGQGHLQEEQPQAQRGGPTRQISGTGTGIDTFKCSDATSVSMLYSNIPTSVFKLISLLLCPC